MMIGEQLEAFLCILYRQSAVHGLGRESFRIRRGFVLMLLNT